MNQKYNLNYEYLTSPTGDPFVDAAGYALKQYSEMYLDLDILELILKVTDFYVDKWDSKLNPFFLNSTITQPLNDTAEKKKQKTKEYFTSLLYEKTSHIKGFCRISGQETMLYKAGRDNSILSGSSKFVNFHHSFEPGIMISKEIIFRLHFLPLACEYLLGKLALIQSSDTSVSEYYARQNCLNNASKAVSGLNDGLIKSNANCISTAMFHFADKIIKMADYQSDDKSCSLTIYHFTNFGASPDLQIYTLPNIVFQYYKYVLKRYKDDWNRFVIRYYINYKYKKTKYHEISNTYISASGKTETSIVESEFSNWRNIIYDKLITGESLFPIITKYVKEHTLNKNIIEKYANKILNMKKETIEKIKQMADFIMNSNDNIGIEKAIKKLNGVKSSYLLRRFVIKDIVEKYYREGNQDAIVTIEDYCEYLFPDTSSWKEIRDLLLIVIYQKLHEKNIQIPVDDIDDVDDNTEE